MEKAGTHKVLERFQITPSLPPGLNRSTLPLTFFDLIWAGPFAGKKLFFYEYPYPTQHFLQTTLPTLKNSLSLTLQHFLPLTGNLVCPPPPHKPFIRSTPNDSVTLTILQSASEFKHLITNHPRGIEELSHLVAELPPVTSEHDDSLVFPLLSLQITVFPNGGLCIGGTFRHVVDGKSFAHFLKSWASVCLNGGDLACIENSMPFYDREVVRDPNGLEAIFLKEYFNRREAWNQFLKGQIDDSNNAEGIVLGTLAFRRTDTDQIKQWVRTLCNVKKEPSPPNLSTFVVTCALLWVSLIKSSSSSSDSEGEEEEQYFMLLADVRNRLEYPLPSTYFGSCLTPCVAVVKKKELMGELGVLAAVRAIDRAISKMKADPFEGAENWMTDVFKIVMSERSVKVGGSPKFSFYETDFGFGRPIKVQTMIASKSSFSLGDGGNEEDGIEAGLALSRDEANHCISVSEQELKALLLQSQSM